MLYDALSGFADSCTRSGSLIEMMHACFIEVLFIIMGFILSIKLQFLGFS
jgi:hypothetical protein